MVAPTPTSTRPSTRQGCRDVAVGTYWRRCLGERPLRARIGRPDTDVTQRLSAAPVLRPCGTAKRPQREADRQPSSPFSFSRSRLLRRIASKRSFRSARRKRAVFSSRLSVQLRIKEQLIKSGLGSAKLNIEPFLEEPPFLIEASFRKRGPKALW